MTLQERPLPTSHGIPPPFPPFEQPVIPRVREQSPTPEIQETRTPPNSLEEAYQIVDSPETAACLREALGTTLTKETRRTLLEELYTQYPDSALAGAHYWQEELNSAVTRLGEEPLAGEKAYHATLQALSESNPHAYHSFVQAVTALFHAATLERLRLSGAEMMIAGERDHYREVARLSTQLLDEVPLSAEGRLRAPLAALLHDENKYPEGFGQNGEFESFGPKQILLDVKTHELRAAVTTYTGAYALLQKLVRNSPEKGGLTEDFWQQAGIDRKTVSEFLPPQEFLRKQAAITAGHGQYEWSERMAILGQPPVGRPLNLPTPEGVSSEEAVEPVLLSYVTALADNISGVTPLSAAKYAGTNFSALDLSLGEHLDSYLGTCTNSYLAYRKLTGYISQLKERFPQTTETIDVLLQNTQQVTKKELGTAMAFSQWVRKLEHESPEIQSRFQQGKEALAESDSPGEQIAQHNKNRVASFRALVDDFLKQVTPEDIENGWAAFQNERPHLLDAYKEELRKTAPHPNPDQEKYLNTILVQVEAARS